MSSRRLLAVRVIMPPYGSMGELLSLLCVCLFVFVRLRPNSITLVGS